MSMHHDFRMFDWLAAPVLVVDAEGCIVHWNSACAELTGHPFDTVRGRNALSMLLSCEELERIDDKEGLETFRAVLSRETERHYITVANEHRWVSWKVSELSKGPMDTSNATAVRGGDGGGGGGSDYVVALGIDVTDRKRAEDMVMTSQAALAGIVAIAADAVISTDDKQRIVIFNEGAERIFGYARDEVLGQYLDLLLPERFRRIHREHLARFAKDPEKARKMAERKAVFGRRKNGDEFFAEAAISKLSLDGRNVFTVVLRDVSERKRAEDREHLLLEVSDVLVSSIDYEKTMRTVAKLAARSLADCCVVDIAQADFESNNGATLGRMCRRIAMVAGVGGPRRIAEYSIDRSRPHLTQAALERRERTLVLDIKEGALEPMVEGEELRSALRELHPRSLMTVPLAVGDRVLGAIAFLAGPNRQPYEPADLRLAEEIAGRAALAVDNAIHYKQAQSAVRTREDILAIVSHDLRNLLSQNLMGAACLKEMTVDETARKTLSIVRRSAERMTRLVSDLLDFASLAAGRFAIKPQRANPAILARDAITALAPVASVKSVGLDLDVPNQNHEIDEVVCDPERVFQVLANLIGNAIKFSAPGARIAVRVKRSNGALSFAVADSGPGIREEDKGHLFDRYWRARGSSETGTGLGLAIAKGIVEAHGGEIWVDSKVGEGSTFIFTLPLPPETSPTSPKSSSSAAASTRGSLNEAETSHPTSRSRSHPHPRSRSRSRSRSR